MGKTKKVQEVVDKVATSPLYGLANIETKNKRQEALIKAIKNKDIVMCCGPAGTGKTHLAILQALHLVRMYPERFEKVVLIKSVTTVKEEEIGFLPGEIEAKMAPYMYSFTYLIDKFFKKKGKGVELMHKGIVEWLPLAFVRGINIDKAIVILDETQNITADLFKTIISRLGEGSKIIFLGDVEQIDLKSKSTSCFERMCKLFENAPSAKVVSFEESDCIRNPIIPDILKLLKENGI